MHGAWGCHTGPGSQQHPCPVPLFSLMCPNGRHEAKEVLLKGHFSGTRRRGEEMYAENPCKKNREKY